MRVHVVRLPHLLGRVLLGLLGIFGKERSG